MDERFAIHNIHHDNEVGFADFDPQLRKLKKQKFIFKSGLVEQIPVDIPGIYSIGGGRQIGKTTLLKQWMYKLIGKGIEAKNITYITGEIIDDHHSLINVISNIIADATSNRLIYLIIDEVTYVKDWDKAIKYLADAGMLANTVLVITGSDLAMMREARISFPGRRGASKQVDFHYFPLSFYEFVSLTIPKTQDDYSAEQLTESFHNYLQHGGYLTAINDFYTNNGISDAVYNTYSDWIRGDVIKHGKSEYYLREALTAIIKC